MQEVNLNAMTDLRIKNIENEILELAREASETLLGIYGDWGRLVIASGEEIINDHDYIYGNFGINQSMNRLEVVKRIIEFGEQEPAYLSTEIIYRLTSLVNE